MPLEEIIDITTNCKMGLWRLTENAKELTGQYHDCFKKDASLFKSERRRKEWIVVRLLLNDLFEKKTLPKYSNSGKPFLDGEFPYLSISHSLKWVVVLVSKDREIGVDIEPYGEKVLKIRDKFLSTLEKNKVLQSDFRTHCLAWSAKESLYKLYGKKELRFTEHLILNLERQDQIIASFPEFKSLAARIEKEDYLKELDVFYTELEDHILTFVLDVGETGKSELENEIKL